MSLPPPYHHFCRLTEGGLCEVWSGSVSSHAGTPALLKRLRPALRGIEEAEVLFRNELRFYQLASSESFLLPVLDVCEERGREYLVLPLFPGWSFQQWRGLTPPVPEVVRFHWAAQSIQRLTEFHGLRSITGTPLEAVHQDLAPQNWRVNAAQEVILIDFGLTRFQGMTEVWEPDALFGRIGYLPPESFAGEKPSQALDWFSLGVTIWELLAGERLFGAPPREQPLLSLEGRLPRSLRRERPSLSAPLASALDRWLLAPPSARREHALETKEILVKESDRWQTLAAEWLENLNLPAFFAQTGEAAPVPTHTAGME